MNTTMHTQEVQQLQRTWRSQPAASRYSRFARGYRGELKHAAERAKPFGLSSRSLPEPLFAQILVSVCWSVVGHSLVAVFWLALVC